MVPLSGRHELCPEIRAPARNPRYLRLRLRIVLASDSNGNLFDKLRGRAGVFPSNRPKGLNIAIISFVSTGSAKRHPSITMAAVVREAYRLTAATVPVSPAPVLLRPDTLSCNYFSPLPTFASATDLLYACANG